MTTVIQRIVDRGLIHSSIDVLCKKAGISKTFFYSFFSAKQELVLQALRYQQPKLLRYAQQRMDDPTLCWQESVKAFLKNCCYGAKDGIVVLSMGEERRSTAAFRKKAFRHSEKTGSTYIQICLPSSAFR